MAKRRYNAKKIAQVPSLKRKLAVIIAQWDEDLRKTALLDMLVYGHRGLISYSEDDLCKRFDKIFNKFLEIRTELQEELKTISTSFNKRWEVERVNDRIKDNEIIISDLLEIANEIFEDRFL